MFNFQVIIKKHDKKPDVYMIEFLHSTAFFFCTRQSEQLNCFQKTVTNC